MNADKVIAKRTLNLDLPNGTSQAITVYIGAPAPDSNPGGDWICHLKIDGLPGQWPKVFYGIDSVQALMHVLTLIPTILDSHAREMGATLNWLDTGSHGFPHTDIGEEQTCND